MNHKNLSILLYSTTHFIGTDINVNRVLQGLEGQMLFECKIYIQSQNIFLANTYSECVSLKESSELTSFSLYKIILATSDTSPRSFLNPLESIPEPSHQCGWIFVLKWNKRHVKPGPNRARTCNLPITKKNSIQDIFLSQDLDFFSL